MHHTNLTCGNRGQWPSTETPTAVTKTQVVLKTDVYPEKDSCCKPALAANSIGFRTVNSRAVGTGEMVLGARGLHCIEFTINSILPPFKSLPLTMKRQMRK